MMDIAVFRTEIVSMIVYELNKKYYLITMTIPSRHFSYRKYKLYLEKVKKKHPLNFPFSHSYPSST